MGRGWSTCLIQSGLGNQAVLATGGGPYFTEFPVNENPLSEGGLWKHLDNEFQTPCKVVSNRACGTQTGTNNLDDSNAYLLGFGNDYEVEATVFRLASLTDDGISREVEILLRWTDDGATYNPGLGDTHCRGYEINVNHMGGSGGLGRFKFSSSLATWTVPATPATGDKFRARIVGQEIKIWWNDSLRLTYTDDAAGFFATGNPGIGFFIREGAANDDFCFENVRVTQL